MNGWDAEIGDWANPDDGRVGFEPIEAEQSDPLFDAAISRFLQERAGSVRADALNWRVVTDGDDEWVVRLWLDCDCLGDFRVTAAGSELLQS